MPMSYFVLLIAYLLLPLMNTQSEQIRLFYKGMLIFVTLWRILLYLYNRKNPENKVKSFGINSFGVIPPEFREMDEGQQWVTFKACRNVYIYYSFALPVTALICFVFSHNNLVPLLSIGVLGIGQYIVYWLTTIYLLKRV